MTILGAHMSIAGGYYQAVERAAEVGCDCVQIFTKNNNQWRAKPITDTDSLLFREKLASHQIKHPLAHSSYLINLASPDRCLWKKSVDGMIVEIQRASQLGVPYVVLHPGSFVSSTESQGLRNIVKALNEIDKQTVDDLAACLLETTAGQGTNLGWRFEHLAKLLAGVRNPDRLGICVDTCHIFAAGYDLRTEKAYKATMREFNAIVGIKQVKALHLNDSKRELGARVDRHAHIGRGAIGQEAFRCLLHDRRFRKIPMYLETPKRDDERKDWDKRNLATLRKLEK